MGKNLKEIILLVLGIKIATFLIIIFASQILPFNNTFYKANFIYPPNAKISVLTSFKTWDAMHYLYLADVGYSKGSISNAFYPLYPLLIKALNCIIGNTFISAILISNIFSFLAVIIFYKLTAIVSDDKTAFISTILFLSFPTAFYFQLIYTESLFLFLVLLFFLLLYKKRYLVSSIVSFFIPLTRVVGFIIILPQLLKILTDKNLKKKSFKINTFNNPIIFTLNYYYILLLAPIFGFAIYLLFMYFSTGDPFTGFKTGELFVGRYSLGNLLNPLDIFKNFFVSKPSLHNFNQSIIDRAFFVLYIFTLPLIYKFLPKTFFVYSLIGLTPFLGSFMGYSRYVFSVFPIFIVLGILYQKKWGFLLLPILVLFLFLQVSFIILYSLNFWVS